MSDTYNEPCTWFISCPCNPQNPNPETVEIVCKLCGNVWLSVSGNFRSLLGVEKLCSKKLTPPFLFRGGGGGVSHLHRLRACQGEDRGGAPLKPIATPHAGAGVEAGGRVLVLATAAGTGRGDRPRLVLRRHELQPIDAEG